MKFIKQFSVSLLAIAASTAALADTSQPFVADSAIVSLDTTYLTANGYTAKALGSSVYTAATGTVTDPLATVNIVGSGTSGPLDVLFSSTSGMSLSKTTNGLTTTAKLTNFSYDAATQTLFGNISVGLLLNLTNQSLLTANTVYGGTFGSDLITNATTSTSARKLNMYATDFVLSEDLKSLLTSNGVDPNSVSFVASMVKSVAVGTVPEPTTYALMGLGLVGIAFARRKQQA
jgi:hypothetical protein